MTWTWYLIDGINPEPWQASLASVGRKKGGNYVQFYKPESLRAYQESVKDYMEKHYPQAVKVAGDITLVFYFWRQISEHEMFEGRNSRTHVADATNMQKALEDALQGHLYDNDRAVRNIRSHIVEQSDVTLPRILIAIGPYDGEEEAKAVETIARDLTPRTEVRQHLHPGQSTPVEEIF